MVGLQMDVVDFVVIGWQVKMVKKEIIIMIMAVVVAVVIMTDHSPTQ